MNDRWDDFAQVLSNPEEQFQVSIYDVKFAVSSIDRTSVETLELSSTVNVLWIYPEERLEHYMDGRIYQVEVIFLASPDTTVKLNQIIVRTGTSDYYRVIGMSKFLSHIEIHCICIEPKSSYL